MKKLLSMLLIGIVMLTGNPINAMEDDVLKESTPWYKSSHFWSKAAVVTTGVALVAGITWTAAKAYYDGDEETSSETLRRILAPTLEAASDVISDIPLECDRFFSGTAYKNFTIYLDTLVNSPGRTGRCVFACGEWDTTSRADMACCSGNITQYMGLPGTFYNFVNRKWGSGMQLAQDIFGLTPTLPSCTTY